MTEKENEGMEKKTKITVGGAVVVAFVVGVAFGAAGGGALTGTVVTDPGGGGGGSPVAPPILLEEAHDGETFNVSTGQRAIVTLEEDYDEGFEWEVTDEGNVTVINRKRREAVSEGSETSHTRIVTVEIDSEGLFEMEYHDPDGELQETLSVTFNTR